MLYQLNVDILCVTAWPYFGPTIETTVPGHIIQGKSKRCILQSILNFFFAMLPWVHQAMIHATLVLCQFLNDRIYLLQHFGVLMNCTLTDQYSVIVKPVYINKFHSIHCICLVFFFLFFCFFYLFIIIFSLLGWSHF